MEPARAGRCRTRVMPPDLFLMFASSGISFVASLMFLLQRPAEPKEPPAPEVTYCLPPLRPPPLPKPARERLPTDAGAVELVQDANGWLVALVPSRPDDAVARSVTSGNTVHDLRFGGPVGVRRPERKPWLVKPGRA